MTGTTFLPLFATSWSIVRAHPVVTLALGGAVLISVGAIPFGIGLGATPWFVCELFAVQLAVLGVRTVPRGWAWARAGLLVLGLVGIAVSATWLAILALGPDVATADHDPAPLPFPEALARAVRIAGVGLLAAGFVAPFSYAPLILLARGGTLPDALLESAWRVWRGGTLRHAALAFLAQGLPLLPVLIAAVVVARTLERAATPLGVLGGLPLVPLFVPLGQGLLAAAYVRGEPDPTLVSRRRPRDRALALAFAICAMAPVLALSLLGVAALRPSPPHRGEPFGERLLERTVEGEALSLDVPDTTLRVEVRGSALRITAGDGGGAGDLLTPWRGPIEAVRVHRTRDVYPVAVRADGESWLVSVDRAAMRVDDTVAARLEARVPPWTVPALAMAFALAALLVAPALAPVGVARSPISAVRRARVYLGVLAVSGVVALAGGVFAALRP